MKVSCKSRCGGAGTNTGAASLYGETQLARWVSSVILPRSRCLLMLFLAMFFLGRAKTAYTVPPNTEITNIARATYSHGNLDSLNTESNIVRVITVDIRSQSTLQFLRYAPANPGAELLPVSITYFSPTGSPLGTFEPLSAPIDGGGTGEIDLNQPVPLIPSTHFAVGEPVFIHLADRDQNLDTALCESILINLASPGNGESELLRLRECGSNTGIFTGYIQSSYDLASSVYNGLITAREGTNLQGNYNDQYDPQDVSSDTITFVRAGISMFITKTAAKNVVSAGDYLQYRIRAENITTTSLSGLALVDNLPFSTRYQAGSATIDGVAASDQQISADGSVLTFDAGILTPGQGREIGYIVEVGPTTRPGKLTNEAYAVDATGTISNTASATVRVREEIFQSETFITGRVFVGECDTSGESPAGLGIGGARIYLEDGTYAVTDSNGMYHFEGIAPGTHVLQLDSDGLPEQYEAAPCDENSQFAGSPYSRFVDIQAGISWPADFQVRLKPRLLGDLKLRLSSSIQLTTINYRVDISGGEVPVGHLSLMIMLPDEVKYFRGSSRLMADSIDDPATNGRLLTFTLGSRSGYWSDTLRFDAMLCSFDTTTDLVTQCMLVFSTPADSSCQSPIAQNTLRVVSRADRVAVAPTVTVPVTSSIGAEPDSSFRKYLDDIVSRYRDLQIKHIYVTGHTDNTNINPRSRHIYPDNYALSLARARAAGEYLAQALNIDTSCFTFRGLGPDQPLANYNSLGSARLNRRVEIQIVSDDAANYKLLDIIKGDESFAIRIAGARPGGTADSTTVNKEQEDSPSDPAEIENEKPGFEWLWPAADHYPPIPSIKVVVKHYPEKVPRLFLDGKEVSSLNFLETVSSQSGTVAASSWAGIDIHEGMNELKAVIYDESGKELGYLSRQIHYSGPPVSVEIIDSLSSLVTDGRTPIVIAAQFKDSDGYPARPGVIGEWSVDPPYVAQQDIEDLKSNPLLKVAGQKPRYVIGENGIAFLELQAAAGSGEALLRFRFIDDEKEIRVWLKPRLREWVLVGMAERSIGYNSVTGNRDNLNHGGLDDKWNGSGRASFFARGSVSEKHLLTFAFDSKRTNASPDSGLFKTINPESFYPLYGDGMKQGYDVASSRGIFAKVEAANYYGMFGDFSTGLNATELSRYNRTFNGLRFDGAKNRRSLNFFLSKSNQAFIRDEIQGDGTSGPYHLTRENVVANSERVVLETRDRFQNDIIVSSRQLRQYLDYNIDYYTGEIFLKMPVASRDDQLNPIFVTIDYESNDPNDWSYNYGGRGGINVFDDKLKFGGTFVHEGRVGGYGNLGSADATYYPGSGFELKTELAVSGLKEGSGRSSGNAYLVELVRNMKKLGGKIFIRDQESDFGLGQQNLNERGTRKYGADVAYRLRESLLLNGQVYRQSYLVTNSHRDFGELKFNYTNRRYTALSGIRFAEDRLGDGTAKRSSQIMAGGSYKVFAGRLEFRLLHEQSIVKNDDPDFPTRTTLGADYRINSHLSFFGQQDFATGSKESANDTRFGFKASPWMGLQINSSVGRSYNENSERLFSNLGLIQSWQINERISVDFGLDHGQLIRKAGNLSFNPNQTPASGNADGFTALFAGASYREKMWSSAGRIEFRDSKSEDKLGVTANIFGEPANGLGLILASRVNKSDAATGVKKRDSDTRLGLVYRPVQSKWMILDRLDLIFSTQKGTQFNYNNWRLVDNITANYRLSTNVSLAFQYGAKYLRETIGVNKYNGYLDLIGLETRYNITRKWDWGARTSLLHSWNLRQYQYGNGISTGYSVFKNAWMSIGYNFSGFNDRDFSDANYTAQGPYLQFRFKFDYTTAKEVAERLGL